MLHFLLGLLVGVLATFLVIFIVGAIHDKKQKKEVDQ